MKRKIIEIDEPRCNGCGKCLPNCPESALQVINGKAHLVSDLFCDGLGARLGECPQGAIRVVEREAEPYDERRVMEGIIRQGADTIQAHLEHLKNHREFKLLEIAVEWLKEHDLPLPPLATQSEQIPGGCPGRLTRKLAAKPTVRLVERVSALRQWPIQLKLLNPAAEYFDHADLLISADCVAHAYGSFHRDLLAGKILIILCPKLDQDLVGYAEKLAEIFRRHEIHSVTVARMEVPCCGGSVEIVRKALEMAARNLEISEKIVTIEGEIP